MIFTKLILVKFDPPIERFVVFQTLSLIPCSKKKKKKKIKPKNGVHNKLDFFENSLFLDKQKKLFFLA